MYVCEIKKYHFISYGQGNKLAQVDLQHAILSHFIFLFFKLVNLNEAIKCFVYVNNDQLRIPVLKMVCLQIFSNCSCSKHRLPK